MSDILLTHGYFLAEDEKEREIMKPYPTLGLLYQLYGDPNGYDSEGSFLGDHLFLHSHEKWETTAKLSKEWGK